MTICTMAFRAQSGSLFTSLDGIPFVINERLKPPAKVTWPIGFEAGNPTDVMFMEYDCQVEEAFIARAAQEREANSVRQQQQRQQELSETEAAASTSSSPTEAAEASEASFSQSADPVQNSVPVQDVSDPAGQAQSAFGLINASSILTPTPIIATSASGSLAKGGASGSTLHNIDLKDFEREQDPFENLSLRVINDREELNKVFHITAPPSQHFSSAAMSTTATAKLDHSTASSSSLLQYSFASNVANGLNPGNLNWVTCQPVPQWPVSNHNLLSARGPIIRPQDTPYVGRVPDPFADHARFPVLGASAFGPSHFQSPQQPAVTSMLRSAKSTPDISRLLDDRAVANARRTPPPVLSDWSSVSDYQKVQGISDVRSTHMARPVPVNVTERAVPQSTIYSKLSRDAQRYVDSVTAMGFDLSDVAMAVNKLGIDDKLVLDHLCFLGKLKDKGYSSNDAAAALLLFDNSSEKAEVFLKLAKNFSELGFSQDQIKDALVRSNLDEEKSLDLLVGS